MNMNASLGRKGLGRPVWVACVLGVAAGSLVTALLLPSGSSHDSSSDLQELRSEVRDLREAQLAVADVLKELDLRSGRIAGARRTPAAVPVEEPDTVSVQSALVARLESLVRELAQARPVVAVSERLVRARTRFPEQNVAAVLALRDAIASESFTKRDWWFLSRVDVLERLGSPASVRASADGCTETWEYSVPLRGGGVGGVIVRFADGLCVSVDD